jgi:L-iditol 2-dehydrogenase
MNEKMGKAVVLYEPKGEFIIREYPIPDPESGTMLLKVELCGICGADIQSYLGRNHEVEFPVTMGHEICGRNIKIGKNVETDFINKNSSAVI